MVPFKTKLPKFCMQAYIAFFTHSFGVLFAHFTTSLKSWSLEVVYFIKSYVLWKFYQVNTAHTFVIRTNEIRLCGFFSSSFYPPFYFAHRFRIFPVTCDIYNRVVIPFSNVYFSITAVIVYAFFLVLKLFDLNKLFICTFCSAFLYGSCSSHAFFS